MEKLEKRFAGNVARHANMSWESVRAGILKGKHMRLWDGFRKKKNLENEISANTDGEGKVEAAEEKSKRGTPSPVDVNVPLENPKLKTLLASFREDGTAEEVLEEIALRARFLSLIQLSSEPADTGNGTAVFEEGTKISFPLLGSESGAFYYAAFTDWEELGKWEAAKEAPKTLILSFDDYADMILEQDGIGGLAVNPFGANLILEKEQIRHMKSHKDVVLKGVSQEVISKDTKVMLGEPKEYPTAMIQAISACLRSCPEVNRVWLRLMERDHELSYLLIVDLEGEQSSVFEKIAGAARPHLNGFFIDMVVYADDFGKRATQGVASFYTRK